MEYAEIKRTYERLYGQSKTAQRLARLIETGTGGYIEAAEYAEVVGKLWSRALTGAIDGLEELELSEAIKSIRPALLKNYRDVAELSGVVQKKLNTAAGIGMNAVLPEADMERIANLLEKLCGGPLSDTLWLLGEDCMGNFSRSAVNNTMERNAALQSEAGLNSCIRRDTNGVCCEWCDSVAGTYEYGQQPADFFRVHKDCTCTITYMPSKQKWQKISYTTQNGKITKNTADLG